VVFCAFCFVLIACVVALLEDACVLLALIAGCSRETTSWNRAMSFFLARIEVHFALLDVVYNFDECCLGYCGIIAVE